MIEARKVVTIEYTLRNQDGEVLESSQEGEPLCYLHGAHQIVPGLEQALTGLATGDEREVVVAPEGAYGPHDPEAVFAVPRAALPPDLQVQVGDSFLGESHEGVPVPVRVVGIAEDQITVDANHPLAGQTLHFHVVVRDVRDARLDELMAGQAAAAPPRAEEAPPA